MYNWTGLLLGEKMSHTALRIICLLYFYFLFVIFSWVPCHVSSNKEKPVRGKKYWETYFVSVLEKTRQQVGGSLMLMSVNGHEIR